MITNKQHGPKIVIVGSELAGLLVARELAERFRDNILIVEKDNYLGGALVTRSEGDITYDVGAHEISGQIPQKTIDYLEMLLKEDLLRRPKRPKMCFQGDFINFPPDAVHLLRTFSKKEMVQLGKTFVKKTLWSDSGEPANFKEAMIRKVGEELYELIYKGYAEKLWSADPALMSKEAGEQEEFSLFIASLKKNLFGKEEMFLYPKNGIGSIVKEIEGKLNFYDVGVLKGARIEKVESQGKRISRIKIVDSQGNATETEVLLLIDTVSLDELYRAVLCAEPEVPIIEWRDSRIVVVHFQGNVMREGEAYYFPQKEIIFNRISEIKRYSPSLNALLRGELLTIEIPCRKGGAVWNMADDALLEACLDGLEKSKFASSRPKVVRFLTWKQEKTHPLYTQGWKKQFSLLYNRLDDFQNLFIIGHKALFKEEKIDACVSQARELSEIILKDKWLDKRLWKQRVEGYLKTL